MNESKKSLIVNMFGDEAYIQANKKLIQIAGPIESLVFGELFYAWKMYSENYNGWFFLSCEFIEKKINISRHLRRLAFEKLKRLGILEIEKRGNPCKFWYRLDFDRFEEIMSEPYDDNYNFEEFNIASETKNDLTEEMQLFSEVKINPTSEVKINPTSEVKINPTIYSRITLKNNLKNNKRAQALDPPSGESFQKFARSIFEKGYKSLSDKDLFWEFGKFGKAIKWISKACNEDREKFKKYASMLFKKIKKGDFIRGSNFTPTTLMANWNYLFEVKNSDASFENEKSIIDESKEKLKNEYNQIMEMDDEEIMKKFRTKKLALNFIDLKKRLKNSSVKD